MLPVRVNVDQEAEGVRDVVLSLHAQSIADRACEHCRGVNPMNKEVKVLYEIKRRKFQYFGHVIRNEKYSFLQLVMQEKIKSVRRQERSKTCWLRDWFGVSLWTLFRSAACFDDDRQSLPRRWHLKEETSEQYDVTEAFND